MQEAKKTWEPMNLKAVGRVGDVVLRVSGNGGRPFGPPGPPITPPGRGRNND